MNELAWELAKIAMCGAAALALICAGCAYGLYRLWPEED